jgi:recombination protein RecT
MANEVVKKENHVSFSMRINSKAFQTAIMNTLQDPARATKFTAALTSAVSTNPDLQKCDASTTLSAALLGESLNLSPSPQLGQYYLVPFNDKKNKRTVATFVLGYKGMIQLAIRSGQYKEIGASEIKDGELISYDPITEKARFSPITDPAVRAKAKTIGYFAWFETVNGFRKEIYWTKEQMEAHASQYSAGYRAHKGFTFWEKDFDSMAKKTMLRQLISKWGIMSIDLQTAYVNDMAAVKQDAAGFEPESFPDDVTETTESKAKAAEPVEVDMNAI